MTGMQTEQTQPTGEYDLAGKVIGLAMKVHTALGPGFLESVYEHAMAHELRKTGLRFESQIPLKVTYDGVVVGDFVADLLVEETLVLELKAIQALAGTHEIQLVNYLTATGLEEGLLLNFGAARLEFKKKFRTYRPPHSHSAHSVHPVSPPPA